MTTMIDLGPARSLLEKAGIAVVGDITLTRLGAGQSNLTFLVRDQGGNRWVARRPPLGTTLDSAHDVEREARIIHALQRSAVPVPRVHAVLRDRDGVPWVLLEHIEGTVIEDADTASTLPEPARHRLSLQLVHVLSAVHTVDLAQVGLADLASRRPYAERQLSRWARQWAATRMRALPELDRLTARLRANAPRDPAIALVHGDLRLRNVISRGGDIVAALDWELSTLGHPLADLGTLLAYWPAAGELPAGVTTPSSLPGFASRDEFVAEYARLRGADTGDVPFWHALGLWKVAIIAEGVRQRVLGDPRNRASRGLPTTEEIDACIERARRVADAAGM